MIKKLLSFVLCLAPFSAMAVTYNPGTGHSVGEDGSITGLNAGESIIIQSGNGIKVGVDGIVLAGNMYIGQNDLGSPTGQLYAETGIDPTFTINSDGIINVAGSLNVYSGKSFGINQATNVSFGSILNTGTINIANIGIFTTGTVNSSDDFSVSAASINAGSVTSTGGDITFTTSGDTSVTDFVTGGTSGAATINAVNLIAADIQNNTGLMDINLTGNLTASGSVENSGNQMDLNAANVTVSGTIKNDNTSGIMNLNVSNLTINGGDVSNASFVNVGDFQAVVSGNTHFEYGVDLSGMNSGNSFSLNTGTLDFGAGMPADSWLQVFANNLDSMELVVNNGNIDATNIVNGISGNTNANMNLQGQSINATSIQNDGYELSMTSTDAAGGIYLTSGITNSNNSGTILTAINEINVVGTINNNGGLILNSDVINLSSIANTGQIDVSTSTSTGVFNVASNITNNFGGIITIESREINIDGSIINILGTTNVRGSDSGGGSVQIGGISSQGGVVNLESLIGSISVDNDLSVTGGSLNFGASTNTVTVGGNVTIAGNLTASATVASGAGNVDVMAGGSQSFLMSSTGGNINITGNVIAQDNDISRTITLDASVVDITGGALASNKGRLIFGQGTTSNLYIDDTVVSSSGGIIDFGATNSEIGSLSGNGKFIARGTVISATQAIDDVINIQNGIWFDGGSEPLTGFVIKDTTDLTLQTSGTGGDIYVDGGVSVGSGNKLTLDSIDEIYLNGVLSIDGEFDLTADNNINISDNINNSGIMDVNAISVSVADINNTGTISISATGGAIDVNDINNSGYITLSGAGVSTNLLSSTAGSMEITADNVDFALLSVTGGYLNLNTVDIAVSGDISVTGDVVQGDVTGMLNLTVHNTVFSSNNFTIGGDFNAVQYTATYDISDLSVAGDLNLNSAANMEITANSVLTGGIVNVGNLILNSNDITLGDVENSGYLEINTDDITNVNSFTSTAPGATEITGTELDSVGAVTLSGGLLQNAVTTPTNGSVNILMPDYLINAASVAVGSINQTSGNLILNTSDLNVGGDINAQNLIIAANGTDWLTMNVDGNINGNVSIFGLERMVVGGDYLFDDTSMLHSAVLSRGTTGHNYWSTVSLTDDDTLGQITNGSSAEPLISINGKFISNITTLGSGTVGALDYSQIGVDIFDIVDQGSAIWLLHADDGIDELGLKTRNLYVKFCNADGSMCYNYLDSLGNGSTDDTDLPAYISVRDTNGDGNSDSLYVVFDPRFGGPVEVFKIQPIVGREDIHTNGEYAAAGALDKLISGRLEDLGFLNRNPIETIPVVFQNTYMEEVASELYSRMEQYQLDHNGIYLTRFSRLFQPTEIDQIAGSISMNEHTSFRDMEDRMFDEFIWNRNRKLKKSWLDADFGMFTQKVGGDNRANGDRLSVSGGFDWKESETLLLGLTGRVTRTNGSSVDNIDISYKLGQTVDGIVNVDVSNTNFGIGGYLMKILDKNVRAYGNAFLDVSMIDVSRENNFVEPISGNGTSFSLISEWGLMHDILNQYIVGNLYARAGYSSGFTINEKSGNFDYMNLQSDGYFILTPGYSLIAQKRIYTSSWFQIRPNISVGFEYDLAGRPDAQFKFAMANEYETYKVESDPLWANAGAGIEFLSANGAQFGIDYRYQYNADTQIHKVRLSGSYRF
ncbi:MAG: hypothetical protein JW985_00410 [Alphaproteobacteria bacterium]|nr:hypothetical protein [Alphaproteobacteria bacterium]